MGRGSPEHGAMPVAELERGRIDGSQMTLLVAGFVMGEALILSPGRFAEHDIWIAVLIGLAEGLILMLVYRTLVSRFPGKTLVEIVEAVYGPLVGKAVAMVYLVLFTQVGSGVIAAFSDFWASMIMVFTPPLLTAVVLSLVCAGAARHGIEVIARCSQVLVPMALVVVVLDTLLLLPKTDLRNLRPVLEASPGKLLWAGHSAGAYPFGEVLAFLMVVPYTSNVQEAPKKAAKGLLLAGLVLSVAAARTVSVLGVTADIYVYPSYQGIRLIDVAMVFTRLEILAAVNLLNMGFLKISVLTYGVALGTAQVLRLRSYRPLVLPAALLMATMSRLAFGSVMERFEFDLIAYPVYSPIFYLGIPLLTLLVATLRRLPKKGR